MPAAKSHIYLVAAPDAAWPAQFRQFLDGRYAVTSLVPDNVESQAQGEEPARGVVVFYEHQPEGNDSRWFSSIRGCLRCMDAPIVAVTPRPTPSIRARLLAGGASAVCDSDNGFDQVLKEVENRCNLEPVMQDLRQGLLDPFIDATQFVLAEMAGERPELRTVYRKHGYRMLGDYSAVLSLTSKSEGALVLSFPRETSYGIGHRMLAKLGLEVTEDLVQGCLAEIANVIVGRAKGRLAGTPHGFGMGIPTTVAGANHEIRYKPGLPCLVAAFTSSMGDFALQLCMAV